MILIGQYDSPYVRRVAIALRLYGMDYEHRPWSTFADADRIRPYNPLTRVPTLVLDDGEVLIETNAILDHLDEQVGPERSLIPRQGPQRRAALKLCSLAEGLADKSVSLLYERVLHPEPSPAWSERCERQIGDALAALESDRGRRSSSYWWGETIRHEDIAVATAIRLTREAHPALFDENLLPALAGLAARCEARAEFMAVTQPLLPPRPDRG